MLNKTQLRKTILPSVKNGQPVIRHGYVLIRSENLSPDARHITLTDDALIYDGDMALCHIQGDKITPVLDENNAVVTWRIYTP
jgi:hypothetical protein